MSFCWSRIATLSGRAASASRRAQWNLPSRRRAKVCRRYLWDSTSRMRKKPPLTMMKTEEIAPVPRPQNTRTIEVERFLPAGQIDARYFEKPYYIVPSEEIGQESFAVIRDAMSREGVIGLARVVLSSRERPFLVEPMGTGLRGVTLRFSHEVRGAENYFSEIPQMKLPAEMMKLAQHIIRTKSAEFNPSMLEDHYRTALVRILRKKQAKRPAHVPAVKPSQENVVNLMDALRRSIAAERPAKPTPKRGSAKPSARPSRPGAQSRMKLPPSYRSPGNGGGARRSCSEYIRMAERPGPVIGPCQGGQTG